MQQSLRKPETILVLERWLLDIATEVPVNIVALWRAGEALKVEEDETIASRGTIKPAGSAYQPVVYEGRFIDTDGEKDIIAFLQDCATRFDLIEVFERMRVALQVLAKEDPRYA